MEQQNENSSLFDLRVDENTKEQLTGLSKWTMIVVVTSVISLVLSLIQAVTAKTETVEYGNMRLQTSRAPNITGVIISIVISGILAYLLYQFSSFTKKGVNNLNQADLNKGLSGLKSYFMTYGIILIVVAAIVLIALLVVVSSSSL